MKKYRIVYDQNYYSVQQRTFFIWHKVRYKLLDGSTSFINFSSLAEAEEYVQELKDGKYQNKLLVIKTYE